MIKQKTTQPPLSLIVCVDSHGGFAKNGKIPWDSVEDRKHFVKTTTNGICIMGRRTYEDMCEMIKDRGKDINDIEHILPNRTSFVITRNPNYEAVGATVVPDIRRAWQSLDEKDTREIFILGGERMFIEALVNIRYIYINILKKSYDCNKFFPLKQLHTNFKIINGIETEGMYSMKYQRIQNNQQNNRQNNQRYSSFIKNFGM